MKPVRPVERVGNMYVLDVLRAPLDQRDDALAEINARCYSAAIARGISDRSAKKWAEKTTQITKGLVQLIQLRL